MATEWRGVGRWSRRRLMQAALVSGGGALLAACGGTVATPTVAPTTAPLSLTATTVAVASSPTSASASPTRPGPPASPAAPPAASPTMPGTPAATAGGTPGGGTPTRPGTPGAATPTPQANPVLGRMLALVPQVESLPGIEGIWFADLAAQKRNYGFDNLTSAEAYAALSEGRRLTFNNVIAAVPITDAAGRNYAQLAEFRTAVGYDYWQVERTIQAGRPPGVWSRLEGRFDGAAIAAALATAGHLPVAYQGATILSRGQDNQLLNLNEPVTRYTLARLNRVVLEDGALSATGQTALAEAGIDVRAGRVLSFAVEPDHAALVQALGPVVGAILAPPESFTGVALPSGRPTPIPTPTFTRTATVGPDRLPPYSRVGIGLRDDGREHTMVIALVYEGVDQARVAAPVLLRRLNSYRLQATGQQLAERAEPGDAEIVTTKDRAVLVAPLKIGDEPSVSLWLRMFANRDYVFLIP